MPVLQPVHFEIHNPEGELELRWSDGLTTRHSLAELRRLCPCATCRDERMKMDAKAGKAPLLRVIKEAGPIPSRAQIEKLTPVGRYALSFVWNDGHNTGIYSYDFLREHILA